MTRRSSTAALTVHGLATLASGLYRYLSAEGGEKGLWFGVVLSAVALAGAAALGRGLRIVGLALGFLAVVTVGGWFAYEALVLKGFAQAEPRQLVLIVLSAAVAGVLVAGTRKPQSETA